MSVEFITLETEVKINGKIFGRINREGKFVTDKFGMNGQVVAAAEDFRHIAHKMEEIKTQNSS